MLRIKTVIKSSKIHGIGLFATQFIPKGTVTWQYDPGFDPDFSEKELENLKKMHEFVFLKYGYFDSQLQKFIVCIDDQRFINHSSTGYNIVSKPDCDVALRDIKSGEELLCNYNHYESDWFKKRKLKEKDFIDQFFS